MKHLWRVSPNRRWFRLSIDRITYSNFAGTWYELYNEEGKVKWFWFRKAAESFAQTINEEPA